MPWVKVDTSTYDNSEVFDAEAYLTQEESDRGFLIEWAPDGLGHSVVGLFKWVDGHSPRIAGVPQLLLATPPAHPAFGHRPDAETHELPGSARPPVDIHSLRDSSRE